MKRKVVKQQTNNNLVFCSDTGENYAYLYKYGSSVCKLYRIDSKYVWVNILKEDTTLLPDKDSGFNTVEEALTHIIEFYPDCNIYEFRNIIDIKDYLKTIL